MPEPGSSRGTSTRNTWPRGVGRGSRPLDRASISAVVLLAADRASARSRSLDDCDQVVRLTLPSSRPDVRVEHRNGGAGEGAQAQCVVLVGAHQGRHPISQRQAEAVGADVAFGVREPRCEVNVVKRLQQAAVARQPRQHHALGVGEHQADRLTGQCAVQVGQHLVAALEEQRAEVVGAGEDRFDRFERDAVVLAALPRRQQPPWRRRPASRCSQFVNPHSVVRKSVGHWLPHCDPRYKQRDSPRVPNQRAGVSH